MIPILFIYIYTIENIEEEKVGYHDKHLPS